MYNDTQDRKGDVRTYAHKWLLLGGNTKTASSWLPHAIRLAAFLLRLIPTNSSISLQKPCGGSMKCDS